MIDEMQEFIARTEAGDYVNRVSLAKTKKAPSSSGMVGEDSSPPTNQGGNHTMWAIAGDAYFPCETTTPTLPPGQYQTRNSPRGVYLQRKQINLDHLVSLPDANMKKVLNTIQDFWSREHLFRQHGFLWKRGVMLWGPPGSGKTTLLQQLSDQVIALGGLSVYADNPSLDAEGLRLLRKIEPKRPIVVMIEDIDAVTQTYGESELLAMLDGELQIDNVVYVATTNYPERLDKRLVNRPSRFDEIIFIGMPGVEARRAYFLYKNPRLKDSLTELDIWIANTEDLSLAHLRELIVSVECLGNDFDTTIKRIKAMNTKKISSDQANKSVFGFTELQTKSDKFVE